MGTGWVGNGLAGVRGQWESGFVVGRFVGGGFGWMGEGAEEEMGALHAGLEVGWVRAGAGGVGIGGLRMDDCSSDSGNGEHVVGKLPVACFPWRESSLHSLRPWLWFWMSAAAGLRLRLWLSHIRFTSALSHDQYWSLGQGQFALAFQA